MRSPSCAGSRFNSHLENTRSDDCNARPRAGRCALRGSFMAIVPQGVSATDFAEALRQFEGAVGKDWVFTKDEDVDLYRDAYSPFWGEEEERRASAAVAPASVEQVQAVMRIANQYKVPMYPVSTGRNLGYGGSAPNHTGSVVLDLK